MKCPVCNRDNAFTLSICPSCGSMMNDSVREELISKITPLVKTFGKPIPKPENFDVSGQLPVQDMPNQNFISSKQNIELNTKPEVQTEMQSNEIVKENPETTELEIKNTNPTLVEFHNKNAKLPEWRLELKNAVNRRNQKVHGNAEKETVRTKNIEIADSPVLRRRNLKTSGANALKVEPVAEKAVENAPNPKLAAALQRIEKSRKKFLESEKPHFQPVGEEPKRPNSVLYFTAKPNDHLPRTAYSHNTSVFEPKQKIGNSLRTAEKLDTNKLPALPKPAKLSSSFTQRPVISEVIETNFVQKKIEKQEIAEPEFIENPELVEEIAEVETEEIELQEIDDCAPFAMRFNAGLFDLIIGAFVSFLMLIPFMAMGGEWFTAAGFFAFLATTSIVMFIYMTTAIGLYGRTFGMKLFSLEVVDIEGEEYPTVHQAAVSSSVYLISLALGGIGFLTLLFNEEKRAAHDLVSRTIVVKEF